jgi:SAM-dependent methyltransferase
MARVIGNSHADTARLTFTHGTYGGTGNLEVMQEAFNYNAFLLDLIRRHTPESASVLDFGAGSGTFATPLHRQGFNITCVEPDAGLGGLLQRNGLEVATGLDDLEPASFDFIYSLNVLEHIEDDDAALRALHVVLKPGGRLLIYVPAFQLLFTSMDRKVGHFRRYRKADLVRQIRAAGYIIDTSRYVDSVGFAATLAFRAIGNSSGELNRSQIRWYDRFVLPVSLALDRVFAPFFGKNLLVVARRPAT